MGCQSAPNLLSLLSSCLKYHSLKYPVSPVKNFLCWEYMKKKRHPEGWRFIIYKGLSLFYKFFSNFVTTFYDIKTCSGVVDFLTLEVEVNCGCVNIIFDTVNTTL